jgi:CRISPR-associated protein Csx17
MKSPLPLAGCRHDVLGHYLKAIGLLRVISICADAEHRDSDAEGWWDPNQARFVLRSSKYKTIDELIDFFATKYRPTPVFSAWNTAGGLNEKKEVIFSIDPSPWVDYCTRNAALLSEDGYPLPANETPPINAFHLTCACSTLPSSDDIDVTVEPARSKKLGAKVRLTWSKAARDKFFSALQAKRDALEKAIKFTKPVEKKFKSGDSEFVFDVADEAPLSDLAIDGVRIRTRVKETGNKAVMALLAKELSAGSEAAEALASGRMFFERFQADNADERLLLEAYREQCPPSAAEAFDAIFTTRASSRPADNPVFLNRGDAGAAEVFRSFWVFFREMRSATRANTMASLCGLADEITTPPKGKGSPFFPDAIKSYNAGSGWIQEDYPFYPLDYVLAVEGGYALRGSSARTIAANSRRFAAFPFVFDATEDIVDDSNAVKGTASALWLPLWERPTTFSELASFVSDAQSRLPGKEARFSAEFVRALNAQGVDAGFSGWQEFRFKMRGSRVPWITTGRYVDSPNRQSSGDGQATSVTTLNLALAPLDESRFLDQFDIVWKGNKADTRSPHPVRTLVNAAMETAALEPAPENCLRLLECVFSACRSMCASESLRERLRGKRASFFEPLPMEEWNKLLAPLEHQPEFRIARALASITELQRQGDGRYSETQPMLGSLLPLRIGRTGWYLPEKGERKQSVWTGESLAHDLASVFRRRYLDSLNDDRPALRAVHGARLADVLAFLDGELDDRLIARWTEALSLIGWRFENTSPEEAQLETKKEETAPIPFEYAALRTVLELECEWQGSERHVWKKRRSQQPFALMCERSTTSLPLAVSEASRWISIWGVPNAWSAASRAEKRRIAGRYVVQQTQNRSSSTTYDQHVADRLAAAVCIPLLWKDRWQLYRAVTLPPGID